MEYVSRYPDNEHVVEYQILSNFTRQYNGHERNRDNNMTSVINSLPEKVLQNATMVFGTSHVISELNDRGFFADVVVMDEVAQMGEPCADSSLMDQRKVKLVIFAGDECQLGPVANS